MKRNFPIHRIQWVTSVFLITTLLATLTATPWYLYTYGIDTFQFGMFFFYFIATGLSITLGYHRLFSHLAFKAKWPVKLFTLVFGAAAFENSALDWCADHRRHHKHVDHDDDPYDISKGFWYAHMGWLLFKLKPKPPMDNVSDLKKDAWVMWQHRWCHWIGFGVGFILPSLLGYWHAGATGALGGFLIAGVARVTFVQQMTFFINSLCHYMGRQPYSTKCSARDSGIMAIFTFGEGYHNFHHEFQHDYRNGVKPWQFDPTKWAIWLLSKLGLASQLRRVPAERILMAEITEARKRIDDNLKKVALNEVPESIIPSIQKLLDHLTVSYERLGELSNELQDTVRQRISLSRDKLLELRAELKETMETLHKLKPYFGKVAVA